MLVLTATYVLFHSLVRRERDAAQSRTRSRRQVQLPDTCVAEVVAPYHLSRLTKVRWVVGYLYNYNVLQMSGYDAFESIFIINISYSVPFHFYSFSGFHSVRTTHKHIFRPTYSPRFFMYHPQYNRLPVPAL